MKLFANFIVASATLFLQVSTLVAADDECQTIVEIASGNRDFETLVAALGAADLVEALEGDGPFTVFAPTDAAFANLPDGTLDELLLPASKDTLAGILLYHVVADELDFSTLRNMRYTTLKGDTVSVRKNPFTVNRSNVVTRDIEACNGIIHIIDAVLLPPAPAPAPVDNRPRIKKVGDCSSSKPCRVCEGDCDHDDDCRGNLVCFSRRAQSFRRVPGCRGGESDRSGTDYCARGH